MNNLSAILMIVDTRLITDLCMSEELVHSERNISVVISRKIALLTAYPIKSTSDVGCDISQALTS